MKARSFFQLVKAAANQTRFSSSVGVKPLTTLTDDELVMKETGESSSFFDPWIRAKNIVAALSLMRYRGMALTFTRCSHTAKCKTDVPRHQKHFHQLNY